MCLRFFLRLFSPSSSEACVISFPSKNYLLLFSYSISCSPQLLHLFPSNLSFLKPTYFYSWHHYFLSLKLKTSKVTLDSSFPGGSVVKHLSAMQEMQETWVGSLGRKDPPEEETATHSSILAWEIPWTG